MSQQVLTFAGSPLSGAGMIAALESKLQSLASNRSGTSRPSDIVSGELWLDTTTATAQLLKFWDGIDDITICTINATTNSVTFSGLGTAALLNVGTSANNVVQLDGSAKLPAVDGSNLTNLPGGGGYKTIFIGGGAMTPSQTAGATPAIIEDGTNDLTRPCMMFKGVTADTSAEWCHAMPEDWDLGTVKAKVMWSGQAGASASDTVRFLLAAGAFSDNDALDAALGAPVTMDDTVTAALDMQTTPASAALTIGGTPVLGDLVRWKVTRDFDYGAQPMTEDAAVIGVWIQYQATVTPAAW